MRGAIFSGACVLLVSFLTPIPALAQSNPTTESPRPSVKLPEDQKDAKAIRAVPLETLLGQLPPDLRDKLARLPRDSKAYMVLAPQMAGGGPSPQDTCAHILIQKAPVSVDPEMVSKVPEGFASNMPILRGLPPCPQDIRTQSQFPVHMNRLYIPPVSPGGAFVPPPRAPNPPTPPTTPKL